jgi:hypothetical protein
MKIYSFWTGGTTYFTTSSSLKKAQAIGKEVMEQYLETCKYLGEEPQVGEDYFIPDGIERVTKQWFKHLLKTDPDTLILDDALYNF